MSLSALVSTVLQHGEHAAAAAAPQISPWVVWMVPLLPVFGFLFQTFIGRLLPKPVVAFVSCAVVLGSCIISWILFSKISSPGEPIVADIGPWINIPGLKDGYLSVIARHKLIVDQLTCVMILVVTNIGFLIHCYSISYMADEKRFARYFSYLNLFTGFMLILVMASNLLLMFVGWEGVGLCSYLLIGFWFEKNENAAAGMKAFVVNRVGDLAFTIGALTLFVYIGRQFDVWTVDFEEMKKVILMHGDAIPAGLATFVCIMLFTGATGKSAQMPLYVWLPDAMAGPTPVSALIHAATMVTAGVYMIARMNFLFSLSPTAMAVVTGVGALTAIFAGSIGIAQNDIKKVLAYSTVSQLGFMFMAVGVGAYAAGVFHLFTHAFFKACLFLGSGSVIMGMHHEQDIRKMGGLKPRMPLTFWTFVIASAALSGVPPLAGFFSKDEILWKAWSTTAYEHTFLGAWYGKVIWLVGACAAACTAFYMTRLVIKTFLDRPKWGAATAFSGAGLPDWMDEEEKKKEAKKEPPKGTGPDGMPAWMEDDPVLPQDESMLDMGSMRKKPAKSPEGKPPAAKPPAKKEPEHAPPTPESLNDESHAGGDLPADESMLDLGAVGRKAHAHEDHGHAHDLPQDESMLDLGRVGKGGTPKPEAHDPHAHDAVAHDAGHGQDAGHGHDAGHDHGHGEPHESPFWMVMALVLLAVCSIWVGFLNRPPALGGHESFSTWLKPVTEPRAGHGEAHAEHKVHPIEYALMLVSILAAVGGIGAAWYIYGKRSGVPAQDFTEKHKELYELVRDKYRVDELYEKTVIQPLLNLNEGTCRFDNEVVDGAVNGAAWVGRTVAKGVGLVDNEVVDAAVNGAAVATQIIAKKVRRAQTGNIKEYLTFALVGGLFVIALFCLYLTRENLLAKIRELFGS